MQVNKVKNTINKLKMAQGLRREVLKTFKTLHRTRQKVFSGDDFALQASRQKINEEFKNNRKVTNEAAIAELVQYSKEVEKELRESVIQAKEVEPGLFEVKIRPETVKLDNVPYKES